MVDANTTLIDYCNLLPKTFRLNKELNLVRETLKLLLKENVKGTTKSLVETATGILDESKEVTISYGLNKPTIEELAKFIESKLVYDNSMKRLICTKCDKEYRLCKCEGVNNYVREPLYQINSISTIAQTIISFVGVDAFDLVESMIKQIWNITGSIKEDSMTIAKTVINIIYVDNQK